VVDLSRRRWKHLGKRNKTIILVRASTGAKAGPKGAGPERAAQRFRKATRWPVSFGLSERNKIKILLRSWRAKIWAQLGALIKLPLRSSSSAGKFLRPGGRDEFGWKKQPVELEEST